MLRRSADFWSLPWRLHEASTLFRSVISNSFTEASTEVTLEAMTTPLLTIAEASEKTGRSASTIRRLIHTITETDNHPDRTGVEPKPKAVVALKKKGENFTWKISEEVLMKNFEKAQMENKKTVHYDQKDILQILKGELELKNQQIEKQWEVIHALNDRLREGNILMGSLQQRLALPEGTSESPPPVEASVMEADGVPSTEGSGGSQKMPSTKPSMKATAKAPRRGIWSWFAR